MGIVYNYNEFLLLLTLFVLSILLVIFLNDLFTVILGWDGLGVISFFLIVFYQSPTTVFSG
jgi:NADH-ubiquinone oxidoreductase chain 5